MKQLLSIIVTLLMGLFVLGCSNVGAQSSLKKVNPEISIEGPVNLDKKGTVKISGKGFQPGSEVVLLFSTSDGVQSDIGDTLKPAPKADAEGKWKTTWKYGRLVKKKLVSAGGYAMVAVDNDYNKLASVTFTFKK